VTDLAPPWGEVFELMWDAYAAGTIPVGAVVVDAAGTVVARGRNRIFDEADGAALGRSRLAHAEIIALAQLPPPQTYEDHTRYAGEDIYAGGVGKLVPVPDHAAHPVVFEGPLPGVAGRLPELLHVRHMLWRVPDGNMLRCYRETRPRVVEAAAALPAPDAGATLADAFAAAR
jgi:hypothetical protein